MPYKIVGSYVVNTDTGAKKNKTPLPKPALQRYLKALYANVPEEKESIPMITTKAMMGMGHIEESLDEQISTVRKAISAVLPKASGQSVSTSPRPLRRLPLLCRFCSSLSTSSPF